MAVTSARFWITSTNLFYMGPPGPPQQGLFPYAGRAELSALPDVVAVVTSFSGHVTDVCALLAA
ncbi:MAG: hypothetical protein E6I11_17305 [Chloroflexi bacterium]|nr:MAG: hypothetical protein E6I17_04615 [Chloroflexota bacterium]TMF81019.1 MAG: hypothetical protein E6I11_17305 [Chloroflexota bacterium]TMG09736.1 MAG: hypothetical protein E6I00_14475 [Chloroflexota bacterium]